MPQSTQSSTRRRSAPWAFLALTLGILSGSAVGCGADDSEKSKRLFDEDGVWLLQSFDLQDGKGLVEPPSSAENGFLLRFDRSSGIVAASACADQESGSHDVRYSNCDVPGSDDTRHFVCYCYDYEFSGSEMIWEEFEADTRRSKRQDDSEEEDDDDDEEASDKDAGGPSEVYVHKHETKGDTYIFSPLPNPYGEDEEFGGLFQSNGIDSRHTFVRRIDSMFERTGCAEACGID